MCSFHTSIRLFPLSDATDPPYSPTLYTLSAYASNNALISESSGISPFLSIYFKFSGRSRTLPPQKVLTALEKPFLTVPNVLSIGFAFAFRTMAFTISIPSLTKIGGGSISDSWLFLLRCPRPAMSWVRNSEPLSKYTFFGIPNRSIAFLSAKMVLWLQGLSVRFQPTNTPDRASINAVRCKR